MEIIADIPFVLDEEDLLSRVHIDPDTEDAEVFHSLVELAESVGSPKAAFRVCTVDERKDDWVRIEGTTFHSRTLVHNLTHAERVFAHVATCGRELDDVFESDGDFLRDFWWDAIKNSLLNAAVRYLMDHLHTRFRLEKTAAMRPGSGDVTVWPITQQRGLFDLIGDVESSIGVVLTDSYLMMPNKSLSGVLFATENDFRSCEVCLREDCPSRSAEFNQQLWNQVQ